MKVRCLFAGTPEVAAVSLTALLASEHEVIGVLSRPDAPAGRGRILQPSPVHIGLSDDAAATLDRLFAILVE